MLKREGLIKAWHYRQIPVGSDINRHIDDKLEAAEVILLLVSPDFLASSYYCYDKEVQRAMQRHEKGSARVIPVILRPCDWHNAPFGKLLAAPTDGHPITKWPDRDEAFVNVVQQIRGTLSATPVPTIFKRPAAAAEAPTPTSAVGSRSKRDVARRTSKTSLETNRSSAHVDLIEKVKSELLLDLRKTLEPLAMRDLASVTDAQDELLRRFLENAIITRCATIFPGAEWLSSDRRVEMGGAHYEIIVRESLPHHGTIEIWFIQRDLGHKPRRPESHSLRWNASGKYGKALLFVAPQIKADLPLLGELVEAVFATGYAWYEQQLHRLISDDKVTASQLYHFLRTIVTQETVLQRLWLVSADRKHGCYLVDDRVATAAMARVRSKAAEIGKSAIRIISEFVTSTLPFDETHSTAAVSLNKCIDVDLRESRYSNEKALFMTGEIAFYGSPLISIFPIVRTGDAYLLAVFPTADRSYLEPILSAHQEELCAEFDRFRGSLVRLLETLRSERRGFLTAQMGEYAGGVLGGLIKALGSA